MWVYEDSTKYCYLKAKAGEIGPSHVKVSGLALDATQMLRYEAKVQQQQSFAAAMMEEEKRDVQSELLFPGA